MPCILIVAAALSYRLAPLRYVDKSEEEVNNLLKTMFNVQFIYHFTDRANIKSIKDSGGLLPRRDMQGLTFKPGGNDWSVQADDIFGLDQFVHCCFLPNHPMEYLARHENRIDSIWLKIKVDILSLQNILYTPGVSNESGMIRYNNEEAKNNLDLMPLYLYLDWRIPENHERRSSSEKYEILIPFQVPSSYIVGI